MHRAFLSKSYIVEHVLPVLNNLRIDAIDLAKSFGADVALIPPRYRASARNLLHSVSLRQIDIRLLQQCLALMGLSRLGRSEAHTLSRIDAVLDAACALAGMPRTERGRTDSVDIRAGEQYLNAHARTLLGKPADSQSARIMVTMPSEAATDAELVRELVKAGMTICKRYGNHKRTIWS